MQKMAILLGKIYIIISIDIIEFILNLVVDARKL